MKKKIAFQTLGCKLNFAESSTIARSFPEDEYERVMPDAGADVYVINTCSVTDTADRKCRQAIRKIINRNPDAFVAVVGCYAQLRPEEVSSIEGVDLVLGSNEKFNIATYIKNLEKKNHAAVYSCDISGVSEFNTSWSAGDRTRSFLKVQDGCDYHCAYCTVPLARGGSRNAPVEEIVKEAAAISRSGVREIVLTGVNIGDFGKSSGETLEQLLVRLSDIEGLDRIRVSSVEPNLLTDSIIDLIASRPSLMPHIHMPLQSGCNRILGLMRRRYTREVFQNRVMRIHELIPGASVGADIIVGFPGESDDDFTDTYNFLKALPLTYLHVFTYSPRPGTPASEMPDKVDNHIKEERSKKLIRLSEKDRILFMQAATGSVHDVLFEKKDRNGMISGFTGNYIRTVVPYSKGLAGNIRKVKLTALHDDSTMNGEVITEAEK